MPHGNSKKKKTPYVRTWESTRDQLKIVAGEMKAREAVHHAITEGLGGLQSCVGLGQVPRNRQQVKDMARPRAAEGCPILTNRLQWNGISLIGTIGTNGISFIPLVLHW